MAAAIVVRFPQSRIFRTPKARRVLSGYWKESIKQHPARSPNEHWEATLEYVALHHVLERIRAKARATQPPMSA